MITKVEELRDKHTVSGNNKGDILITGFANVENIHANAHGYELLYQSEVASNGQ